jgi:hypothetical protein
MEQKNYVLSDAARMLGAAQRFTRQAGSTDDRKVRKYLLGKAVAEAHAALARIEGPEGLGDAE